MNHRELRRTFLEFYAKKEHKIVPSMSLIPRDDPTLLFTSAGMVQFKPLWAGAVELPYRRACSVQKCLRATDLPEVGKTPRHCTFFEMLGNFSFGDYFKAEAIPWAWEYLTEVVRLDKERLYVSVFAEDEEAFAVWREKVGLGEDRIYRLGAEDNFWGPAGGTGACGPCSEIYYDLGSEYGCGRESCGPGCDCDRFSEVYNIVFPQYNQLADGSREPLKNRGIDTGMGLERLAQVSQGKKTIFETDLFAPVVKETERILEESNQVIRKSGDQVSEISSLDHPITGSPDHLLLNVAADHARALTFAITDGVIPSNEARGYILRSILRRALLFAHRQGVREPFLYRVSGAVVEHMRQFYPELAAKREQAGLIIKSEEERFLRTLDCGLELWQETLEEHRTGGKIPGEVLFRLHDTFGFPIELVRELAQDEKVELDTEGFEREMQAQRERSKKSSFVCAGAEATGTWECRFVGYERDEMETELLEAVEMEPGKVYEVYLARTPFYAEAGGQVGDTGRITGSGFELDVLDTYYKQGVRVSKARLASGEVAKGQVFATVDRERRREVERAHTATHLLHAALRRVVGDYTKQEGSLVEPGRFRFDFASFEPLTAEQLARVEAMVYDQIVADRPVERKTDIPLEQAKKMGAAAFFAEQYGEKVTVITVPGFSMELCGGTHLRSTGEIGLFRILSETGVAAGIRRIEALVGKAAFARAAQDKETLGRLSSTLASDENLLVQKAESLVAEMKRLEARVKALSGQLARYEADGLAQNAELAGEVRLVTGYLPNLDQAELRLVADRLRQTLAAPYAGFVAGGATEGRLRYIVFVSKELEATSPAGKLARAVGKAMAGGGGGKPDLAEGGGSVDRIESGRQAFKDSFAADSGNDQAPGFNGRIPAWP